MSEIATKSKTIIVDKAWVEESEVYFGSKLNK